MYDISANKGNTSLYGINKGEAQVFDNSRVEDAILSKQRQGLADKKAKDAEQKGLMTSIGKLGKGAIRPADLDYFAGGQKAIYDKVKKYYAEAKGGDLSIDQQVEIENDIVDLQTKATVSAERSKWNTDRAKTYNASQGKFRKDSLDAIYKDQFDKSSAGNWNTPMGDLKEDINLMQDARTNLKPLIDAAMSEGTIEVPLANGGSHKIVLDATSDVDIRDANGRVVKAGIETFLRENLKNEAIFDKASHEVNQLDPEEAIKKYGADAEGNPDAANYYIQTMTPLLRQNKSQNITNMPKSDKQTDAEDFVSDINTPESYKIMSQGTGGKWFDATVEVAQSAQLAKPISIPLTITTTTRDMNGNTLPDDKGVYKTTGSELRVVPVYKKGVKSQGGEVELGGGAIPKERMKDALSKGVVEYKTMFYGSAKLPDGSEKEISIMKPADEIRGALGKSVKTLDQLNEYAKQLNDGVKNPAKKSEVKPSGKTVVKKGYNKNTNQTQLIYSDGSKEIVNGKQ